MTKTSWNLNELQQAIFDNKYNPTKLDFNGWVDRVSGGDKEVARLIKEEKFIFAGRILAHRGLKEKVTYSNCYVMPQPEDNLESIFDTAKYLGRTYSYGGGCGVDISKLRPSGAKVNNSAKETTGAVSFMQLFDLTTGLIGQNGRRGALMISIADSHPDLPEFLTIKTKEGSITKANISVRISDAFMEAVKYDEQWKMEFVVEDTGEKVERVLRARDLFQKLCEGNNDWAEPGMLYWNRIENWHMMSEHPNHKYAGVNPCAEEPLMEGGSCLLASMNLSEYVRHPYTKDSYFALADFLDDVTVAVRALNDVLDEGLERHPLQVQRDNARDWRQIGLGVMGIADMLIKLEVPYGSPQAIKLSADIARNMLNASVLASAELANELGAFPMYDEEALFKSEFFQANIDEDVKDTVRLYGLRNSQIMTIAPTGSISTMWGVSGGIEPIFNISYTRKTESIHDQDVYYKVFTPIVKEYMDVKGIDESELPILITECVANRIHYRDRIMMQSAWQQFIDASISSTVNLPNEATVEDVRKIFMIAWREGLKGITVYREGCKRSGILTTDDSVEVVATAEVESKSYDQDKYKVCGECGELIQVVSGGCAICMNCGNTPCG